MRLFRRKYFEAKLSGGFVSLYSAKTIVLIGTGLLGLFLPIFLYNVFGGNFQYVALYFGLGSLMYAVFFGMGAKFLNKFGFRRALKVSTFLGAAYYLVFYFTNEVNWIYLIPLSLLVLTFYRMAYWLPYHVDFAKFTDTKNRGRELSLVDATREFMGILIPVISGFLITRFSFDVVFVIAVILYCISFFPYLTIPKTKETFEWSYKQTWQELFSKKRRPAVLAFMACGAEEIIGLVVWPIFIFELLEGSYLKVGIISTFIVGITVCLQLLVGKYFDRKEKFKEKVLKYGSLLYAGGWMLKVFVATALQVFIVGSYHSVTKIFTNTPFNALTYEMAADEGHYVDEFTVIHEMALQFGKVIAVIFVIFISIFLPIKWTFILGAMAAVSLNMIKAKSELTDNSSYKLRASRI